MTSQNSRGTLRRQKLDFNERDSLTVAPYITGASLSHKRPHEVLPVHRPVQTVKDAAATEPLPETEVDCSSSSSSGI